MVKINEQRFRKAFEEISVFGSIGDGGISRPAFSGPHLQARQWFRQQATTSGLGIQVDGAANHSVRLEQPRAETTLLIGSHLDSVPHGGRFDGTLGVIAGLEVLRVIKERGIRLPYHLEVIDFTDEESKLVECLGSRALIGDLSASDLQEPRCGKDVLHDAFGRAGINEQSALAARRDTARFSGYLELHIEQGPILERKRVQIGIVSGIVGIRTFRLRFEGEQNHAGTTPMRDRRDAGRGASSFLLASNDLVETSYRDSVVTVGRMEFVPGVSSIVPGRADLDLEFRSLDEEKLDRLEHDLLHLARTTAHQYGLTLHPNRISVVQAVPMDENVRNAIRDAAEELGLSSIDMPSGAGHDAQLLARVTRAGMIFIPSTGGSHNPNENARWSDCVNGANVLLSAVLKLNTATVPASSKLDNQ